jgi:hypothetical protein
MLNGDENLQFFRAVLSEKLERYGEGLTRMKALWETTRTLGPEELDVWRVCLKNSPAMNRMSIRVLKEYFSKLKYSDPERKMCMLLLDHAVGIFQTEAKVYVAALQEVVGLVMEKRENGVSGGEDIGSSATDPRSDFRQKLFLATLYKELGDYHRYLLEINEGGSEETSHVEDYYRLGILEVREEQFKSHPLRLGLVLNQAILRVEVLGQKAVAYQELRGVFNDVVFHFGEIPETNWRETCRLLQIIEGNLSRWREELKLND